MLDKVRDELVVSQWWPNGTTVKIEATSSDNMDLALKFAQTESAPLQLSEDHSHALTIWGVARTKKWAREFKTEVGAGVWYAVAARPVGNIAVSVATISVWELRNSRA